VDLATAFSQTSPPNLIVQANITQSLHTSTSQAYLAQVLKTYQLSGSGNVFEILPQQLTDPCFTAYNPDVYLMAIPWHLVYAEPPEGVEVTLKPEYEVQCFYVALNRCNYFKLFSELTADELAILAKHSS